LSTATSRVLASYAIGKVFLPRPCEATHSHHRTFDVMTAQPLPHTSSWCSA